MTWDDPNGRRLRVLQQECASLRAENLALRELCRAQAPECRQAARDRLLLDEILGSRAWAFVRRARRLAAAVGLRAARSAKASPPESAAPTSTRPPPARPRPQRPVPGRRVSVIVPNYNHAPYLEERLRSLFAQTYPPHEILFLDDASGDESVAVARRLAPESPATFRIVLNDANSGSPFRQWLKGIDLAEGDLIWIAESDDTCRPELLRRLVAEFDDPEVMLAYCQSAIIGADGRPSAADHLSAAEELAPARWRYPYRARGREEVELALSQRNTIPNASAVVFRKPDAIEERADLEALRLCGDWLFYAMRIRRGKIAYIPEPLNGHRHHDRTVRAAFERSEELFEEQLRVRARIFEAFPVTPGAISGSLARGFAEYADRMTGLDPRLAMTEHPRLIAGLDRIRELLRARVPTRQDFRLLVVLSGVARDAESSAAIRLANELSGRCQVFLCNASPCALDPAAAARVGARVIPLEGTLGISPWSWDDGLPARRAAVIRELTRFHRIDAIHTQGRSANVLVAAAGLESRNLAFN